MLTLLELAVALHAKDFHSLIQSNSDEMNSRNRTKQWATERGYSHRIYLFQIETAIRFEIESDISDENVLFRVRFLIDSIAAESIFRASAVTPEPECIQSVLNSRLYTFN